MLVLRFLLQLVGLGLIVWGLGGLVRDALGASRRRLLQAQGLGVAGEEPGPIRWRTAAFRVALGSLPLLLGASLVVVPSGTAGVRVSQLWGTRPGTLYPGVHFIKPLVETLALYNIRDRVLVTGPATEAKKREPLTAQSKEGLGIGLAVSVRYRLDPQRLDHIHANLPQDLEEELIPTVVASVFRDLAPRYMVREVFATKREEIRSRAAEAITQKLAQDAVLVKQVMLSDIVLPEKYAKGLEGLLLKEQENEQLVVELEIKQKNVRATELEAEADKAREVKAAEAQGQVRVLQAKAEADAMQHTLPLKQKQIEQSRLEAEARKEATLRNAEAAAEAKVIDSKADVERSRLLADAEAHRIRVTSAADSERMNLEAAVLKENPLLIQKIIAERLSDKMQIVMVPMDGRNFFAADVLRGLGAPPASEEPRGTSQKVARR